MDFANLTLVELRKKAAEMGIKNYARFRKPELLAIIEAQAA